MFNPSAPLAMPGWNPGAYTSSASSELAQPGDPTDPNRPIKNVLAANGWNDDEIAVYIQNLEAQQAAVTASSGYQSKQLQAQIDDAKAARDNAWKIAQLQTRTSSANSAAQLKETARQFDLNHGLEMQKLGLQRAQTATDYLSTPDRFFQAADFIGMSGRALNGQGPQPYGANGQPTPKTENDFAVMQTSGSPYQASGSPLPTSAPAPQLLQTGGPVAAGRPDAAGTVSPTPAVAAGSSNEQGAAASPPPDPRVGVIASMVKALPPSAGDGLDPQDYAVLNAAHALYSTNLRPGAYESMRPGQKSILESAGKRLGLYTPDWQAQQVRQGVGQGSARSYY